MSNERGTLQFGIGCFYFTERRGHNSSWEEAVRESLNSLPSVSDAEIDLGILLDQEAKAGPGFYPSRGMLRFRLHVPRKEQERLNSILSHLPNAAEHFIIMIFFRYFEPVAFILPQASSATDTFWGVFAAREYLEKEFSRQDLPAEMHMISPTPFHADLSVKAADIDQDFELVRSPGKGREEFTFLYSKESFSSPEMAAVTLIDRISDELSLFYSFNSTQEDRWRERNELVALVQNLIDIYQAKDFKARLRRMFTSSAKIRRVALKAVITEYQLQGDERTSRNEMDELYSRGVTPYFRDFLESEVASRHESEILAARETISILDQARQKQIEVSSLFFSAIAGGLAGALVSLLAH